MGPRDGVGLLAFFLATQAQPQYLFSTKKMSVIIKNTSNSLLAHTRMEVEEGSDLIKYFLHSG